MKSIVVKDVLGSNYAIEDAIILSDMIKESLSETVTLDFSNIQRVSTTFLCQLFTNMMNRFGRQFIFTHIHVKNLSNFNDYKRVILGTTF